MSRHDLVPPHCWSPGTTAPERTQQSIVFWYRNHMRVFFRTWSRYGVYPCIWYPAGSWLSSSSPTTFLISWYNRSWQDTNYYLRVSLRTWSNIMSSSSTHNHIADLLVKTLLRQHKKLYDTVIPEGFLKTPIQVRHLNDIL